MSGLKGARAVLGTLMVLPAVVACTGGGLGGAADCMALAPYLLESRRPAAVVDAAEGMCRPQDWGADEVAADLEVVGDVVWLASGECVNFGARERALPEL